MISHHHRCIFVHIPKTGGTTVEDIIWPDERSTNELWMGNTSKYCNKYQTGGMQHLFSSHIRREVSEEVFYKYFKFSFVRNPWGRVVSQFHYMKERPDLRAFIGMSINDPLIKYLELIQSRVHVQWDNQYKFIYSDKGELMVDFIGRFERFTEDVNKVLSILGIKGRSIPHRIKTDHKPYYEYYDDESIDIVRQLYKSDIMAFGYKFGNDDCFSLTDRNRPNFKESKH